MRIISGTAKNQEIKSLNTNSVRPTTSRMREALFSILRNYINDAIFLDLYSGTGAVGLEALSRGAQEVIMIEQDGRVLGNIIENINNLGFQDRCRAYKNNVNRGIEILAKKREEFDIIFMDPPYKDNLNNETIKKVLDHGILKKGGILISEHHKKEDMEKEFEDIVQVDEKEYGDKQFTFYIRRKEKNKV
ncbi:MAG: 16S rRNA (guanine(966)-N(2))-methyltransferase RsmD [Fusobacteriota bacterium]